MAKRGKSARMDVDHTAQQPQTDGTRCEGEKLADYMQQGLRKLLMAEMSIFNQPGNPLSNPELQLIPDEVKQRVRANILLKCAALSRPTEPGTEVTEELQWIIHTMAVLNPCKVDLCANFFAEHVADRAQVSENEDEELAQYFDLPNVGEIKDPAMILDKWGLIIGWHLPDIISSGRVEEVNIACEQIGDLLKASQGRHQARNEASEPAVQTEPELRFIPGCVEFSPGWFAPDNETLVDSIFPSATLRTSSARPWLESMSPTNVLLNAILAITNRELYLAGHEATSKLKNPHCLDIPIKKHEHVPLWNSVFSGMAIIANRVIPRHRDTGDSSSWQDLLLSAGTHQGTFLGVDDIGAKLSHDPGTATLICAKVLSHSVRGWSEGERICIAGFMRDMVHHRLGVFSPGWCAGGQYFRMMNKDFAIGQGWKKRREVH